MPEQTMKPTAQERLAQYTGDAAQLLAGIIELSVSDARYAGIIEKMQAEGRATTTDEEKALIKGWLDADLAAAQGEIDKLPD